MTVACPPSLPGDGSPVCAGGTCVSIDACECDSAATGRTGFGDFQFGSPSCALNIEAVKGLWASLAALECILFVFAVYYIRVKLTRSRVSSAVVPRSSGRWTRSNLPPLFMGIGVLFESMWMGICGILKASDPLTRVIGGDFFTSIAFSLGTSSFWIASHVFTYHFVMVNLRQSRIKSSDWKQKITDLARRMKVALPLNAAFTVVGCFFPTIATTSTNGEEMYAFAASHFMILGVSMASLGLFGFFFFLGENTLLTPGKGLILVPYFLKPLMHDIKSSIHAIGEGSASSGGVSTITTATTTTNNNNHNSVSNLNGNNASGGTAVALKSLLRKIQMLKDELHRQAYINIVLAVIFGLWKTPQRYSSYFLVFPWISGLLVSFLGLYLNLPTGSSSSTASAHHSNNNGGDGVNAERHETRTMRAAADGPSSSFASSFSSSSFRRAAGNQQQDHQPSSTTREAVTAAQEPEARVESTAWSTVMVAPGAGGEEDQD